VLFFQGSSQGTCDDFHQKLVVIFLTIFTKKKYQKMPQICDDFQSNPREANPTWTRAVRSCDDGQSLASGTSSSSAATLQSGSERKAEDSSGPRAVNKITNDQPTIFWKVMLLTG